MEKRGSVYLIVVFISIVLVIFYMISMQGRAPTLNQDTVSQKTFNYAEIMKRFTFITAEETLTKASYETAEELTDYTIISDSLPTPFSVNMINFMIEQKAKQRVNNYLDAIQGEEFGNLVFEETGSISKVDVKVQDIDMVEETPFENFQASFSGDEICVVRDKLSDETSTFKHQYTVGTQCNRFYYLLNGLNNWAITNRLSTASCNAIPAVVGIGSGDIHYPSIDKSTVDDIIGYAMDDLDEKFDEFVECTYTLNDYIATSEPLPHDAGPCTTYDHVPMSTCGGCPPVEMCGGGCPVGEPTYKTSQKDCQGEDSTIAFNGPNWRPPGPSVHVNCGSVGVHHEILIDLSVSCTDYKCKNPVGTEGMEHLTMNVTAFVHLTHHKDPEPISCKSPQPCGGTVSGPPTVSPTPTPSNPKPPKPSSPSSKDGN